MEDKTLFVYCDGGAINNPGPAGIGVVIKLKAQSSKLKTIYQFSKYIGEATNNQAEYQAVIEALSYINSNLKSRAPREAWSSNLIIRVFLDSELIVNQLSHRYKIKNSGLQPLFLKAHNLAVSLGNVKFEYIPREQNKEADKLVQQAVKDKK